MQTLHGVGGQVAASTAAFGSEQRPNHEGMKSINAARLSKFLESASQALTTLLEEDAERKYGASGEAQDQKDVAFSEKVNGASKEIQMILRLFLVIAMYCQASSINHSISHVDSWRGRKPRYMQ